MVVAQFSGSQGSYEQGKTYEHGYTMPAEMTPSVSNAFFSFMHFEAFLALCFGSAAAMVMLIACLLVLLVPDKVYTDTCYDSYEEQDDKKDKGLLRNHSKHNEGLIA